MDDVVNTYISMYIKNLPTGHRCKTCEIDSSTLHENLINEFFLVQKKIGVPTHAWH